MLKAVLIWGIVFLVEALVVVFFIPADTIVNAAAAEERAVITALGPEASQTLASKAKESFNSMFVESGILQESFDLFVPTSQQMQKSQGMEDMNEGMFAIVKRRLQSFWNVVFVGIQRLHAIAAWFPLLIPFLLACAFDGACIRKIKHLSFGMSSAAIFGAAMHLLVIMLFAPLYFFVWPWTFNPYLVPLWFIILAILGKYLIANLQRM